MENNSLCSPTTRNEQPEEKDGEESNDGSCANAETSNTSERCPICLNFLTVEVGFPEECCHAFCVSCILKWSETSSSCPVDRIPFQAIYKTDLFGSLTKINVKERRPRENQSCVCDQTLTYCTKEKLGFRVCVKEDAGEVVTQKKEKECLDNKSKPEMEIKMTCPNCITGDILATCPFTFSEATPCFNNRTEQEESEVCLIQRKREALKHLRIPFGAAGIQSISTLPAEILVHPPSPLDEYIFPLSPIPFRSQAIGSSTRVCAHTGGHEGNEKKQAASGTSTSRGTRKKSVQSNTRRRSTRNSKSSDTSNLQSSPKSSSSDHDTPGHNTTNATNAPPSEHTGKQSSKQQKQAPKKGSRTRKRICSATQYQDESKDDKDSETEAEQEKKCKLSDDNVSDTEQCKLNQSPNNSIEKECEHTDMSSPLEHSEEKTLLNSSPAHTVQPINKERSASPDFHNKHQFHEEHSSPSPVFKNGQADLEDSQADFQRSVNEASGANSTENKLDIEAKPSRLSENLNVSDEERSSSPPQSKHIISDDTELPTLTCEKVEPCDVEKSASSSSSPIEIKSPIIDLPVSPRSEEIDINAESHSHPNQVTLQSKESNFQSMESSSIDSMLPPVLEKQCDLDDAVTSPDGSKDHSIQKPESIQLFEPDESLKSVHKPDELEKVLEVSLQSENQEECIGAQDAKTSTTSELNNQHSSESSTLLTDQSEQSLVLSKNSTDQLSTTLDNHGNILCKEELHSPNLGDGKILDTDQKKDLNNDHQKTLCDDNTESVAMECDSQCSDHNESEVEQPVNITEPTITEIDAVAANKVSPPKQPLPPEDASKKESRTRKSRFHSPSTTWSPSKNDVKERQKSLSPSKARDSPIKHKSRSPSKDKDGEHSHVGQRKGRSRDRHHRRHSRSRSRHSQSRNRPSRSRSKQSKSRSRSRSGSRTRHKNRIVTVDRNEKDCVSPPWKERRPNENWRSPWGSEKYRRNEFDKHEHFRNDKYEARDSAETYPDNKNDYPDWVVERIKAADNRGRGDAWMRGEGRGGERGWGDHRGRGDRARGRGDFRGRGERSRGGDRGSDRSRGGNRGRGYHWDDGQYGSGDSWNRNVNMDWNSPRSRGGRGRGGFRGGFNYGDQHENNWNNRQPSYSGNSAPPIQECSRFLESKNKPKYEDMFDSAVDRSGWSSASSWAVRKTLPADVQNYYSKRGRSTTGSQGGVWPRSEESQDQDQAATDQASQQNESTPVPVNMVQTQMNVVQQPVGAPPQPMNIPAPPQPMNIPAPPQPMNIPAPPQPMNIPAPPQPMNIPAPPQPMNMFPYSVGVHPPLVNIQHNPYNIHPQLPIHLHPALPLVQMSAPSSVPQGLPPPPPPPPPSQQISYIAPQQDAKPLQGNPGATYVSNNVHAPLLPAPASVQGTVGVLGSHSASFTSGYSKNSFTSNIKYFTQKESVTVESSADSSKKEKKILIQERAAQEVKLAIRPYYQNKDITKDEYKEIMKKAVDKVCHSKSGEVDSAKVANLVKAYVDKYKHSRKKGVDDKL